MPILHQFEFRLALALLLGAVLGVERQIHHRSAGTRTNALVALGAALFVLIGQNFSGDASATGRVAGQVITGIGFLGAGAILREGTTVVGLTTAATVWCAAGVGMLAGLGNWYEASLGTVFVLAANVLLRPLDRLIDRMTAPKTAVAAAAPLVAPLIAPVSAPAPVLAPMNPSPSLIIVMGVSGCGKTTVDRLLAQRLGQPFYDADDYHSPANIAKMRAGIALTDADRAGWLATLAADLGRWATTGGAVLACSALKESYRQTLQAGAPAPLRWVFLDGDPALLRARLLARTDHFMQATLLHSQLATLAKPAYGLRLDVAAAPAQLVDQAVAYLQGVALNSTSGSAS